MQEDHQPINRIFFAGAEIMSPKKWFRTILRLKKRKEDKSEQAKVISFFVYTIWYYDIGYSIRVCYLGEEGNFSISIRKKWSIKTVLKLLDGPNLF